MQQISDQVSPVRQTLFYTHGPLINDRRGCVILDFFLVFVALYLLEQTSGAVRQQTDGAQLFPVSEFNKC